MATAHEALTLRDRLRGMSGVAVGVTLIAMAFSLFHLTTSFRGTLSTLQQVYVHLGFAMALIFLTRPIVSEESRFRRLRWFIDAPLVVASVVVSVYPVVNFLDIARRGAGDPTEVAVVLGVIATFLVLESARRMVGWALPLLSSIFIVYAFVGPHLPMIIAHRGFNLERVSATLYLTTNGIAGTPLQVSATYVAIFIVFAAFLNVSGAGKFFIDWSYAALAWFRGGPAKVAILGSALMGTINGSAVANTVATGTFTIPIMKRAGLRPAFAGAVEATASSGGQLMPPVMGAAAFIMVEVMGRPYSEILTAAALPAVLYFVALFAMVDFQVARQSIKGIPRKQLPSAWKIFKKGWHLIAPLVLLIYLLVIVRYTPIKAAFFATIAVILASWLRANTRMGVNRIVGALKEGGLSMLEVAAACAAAGITIGILMLTGLALRLSGLLIDFSGGNLMVLLFLTMGVSIILGMGLPTSAVYVVLASLVVPAMVKLGVEPMAAHLFVLYFGVMANVTPPVAIAAYAGAGLAGADPTRTGVIAFRLALAGFILPFLWVYNPALIMQGPLPQIILAGLSALIGILSLAATVQGYLFSSIARIHERVLLGIGAFMLIKAGLMTDLIGLGAIGLAIGSRFMLGAVPLPPSPVLAPFDEAETEGATT
ncbi:TRAP transporter permease [Acuticoccus sp. M5D2P5]|uniref:TRAP transporter permease n=1 Tax=Acuticoccus kalidii TaxID=2910977 RepID=UPI001F1A4D9A|nr:TRAP transporter permease [Acuticoccus kalidii]MCF3933854.1 TRAP transporter permease [Acuticoccus kalidii]